MQRAHLLASWLSDLRREAGLTGRQLSARCGWHPAKTSRIQSGTAAPSADDVRAWCHACRADEKVVDLIALQGSPDGIRIMQADSRLWRAVVTVALPNGTLIRHYGPYTTREAAVNVVERLRSWASCQDRPVDVGSQIQQCSVSWVS